MAHKFSAKRVGSKWTDPQWAGISEVGRSLLVSAAAGSGKTAVLAERCAHLVCDADEPCDVDELLVVTFTEAAAAEMKSRIEKSLRDRIAASPTPRLSRQLALIDRMQVSTLHAFCSKLIRQHFHLLDLDPAFVVIDADEASLLRNEVARELFEESHAGENAAAFQALVDCYGDGYDQKLIGKVLQTHDLLGSLVEPEQWIAEARKRIADASGGELSKSTLGKALYGEIDLGLSALARSCEHAIGVATTQGIGKYVAEMRECESIIRHWRDVFQKHGLDPLVEEADLKLGRLAAVSESTAGKKIAKGPVDEVRDAIKSGTVRQMLYFTAAQWQAGLKSIAPHADVFLDLVQQFGRRYKAAKDQLRGVDFSDLERLALKVLREPSGVARMLSRQYAHVLVDEYQDINELQDEILARVSREKVEGEKRNLFCVGDVKQAIYRFRLADPARFLERERSFRNPKFPHGDVIDLQANFRSRPPLLETLNGVFARLMTREAADIEYDDSHRLHPGLEYPAGDPACFTGSPVELHLLPAKLDTDDEDSPAPSGSSEEPEPDRAQREAALIAQVIHKIVNGDDRNPPRQVMERQEDGSLTPRPIRYGDIVILLRSMRFKGDDYAEVLRRSNIPVHSESSRGYFESMEIADMLALLKALDNRAQDIPLAAVLRSPIASLPNPEDALATIRLAYKDKSTPFHQAVVKYADEQDNELAAKLKDVLNQLDRWRDLARQRPLAELIWDVYDSTGYLAFCSGLRDGEQRKANLIDLHDRARQFGSFQRQGLSRFLTFLEQLREEQNLGQPPVVSEGENVVRIMTIHHSKGLEFPVVILPDLGKLINLSDCKGSILVDRHAYLGMEVVDEERQVRYPSLASTLVANRLRRQSMAEELRVLYVAMTRAKEHLIGIGTCGAENADDWKARWTGHVGALPADTIQDASSMLDWLGPVAAAMRTRKEEPIQIISHSVEEVQSWPTPESLRPSDSERQKRLALLEPPSTRPGDDRMSKEIMARLDMSYPFAAFTKLRAAEAATTLAKPPAPAKLPAKTPAKTSATAPAEPPEVSLDLPRAVQAEIKPSAASIGEATHLLLQHIDFARKCDVSDLKSQISDLIARRLISPPAAESIDLSSVCWLAESPVGQLLRKHASELRRELPLYFALRPEELDPQAKSDNPHDRVMLRSRIDVLVPAERGLEIVDYKTDRIARPEIYKPQMKIYRRAIEAMTGKTVAAVHLVFLSARRIESEATIKSHGRPR